jgi:hypothetical protein
MIIAVLYDIVKNQPLSYTNEVDPLAYPERVNPDHKYYVPFIPFNCPNYDSRYYIYVENAYPLNTPHPTYTLYGRWVIEYPLEKKPIADIHRAVDNAEMLANITLKDEYLDYLYNSAIIKKVNEIILDTDEEQAILDMAAKCVKIKANRELAINKKTLITNGQEPDIDALWDIK